MPGAPGLWPGAGGRRTSGPFRAAAVPHDTLSPPKIASNLSSRGRFSVVKKCDQKGTKRAVATKFVNKKLMKRDQVTHELGVLLNVQHPLLVSLLDTFETPTSYVLVLEMCVLAAFPPLSPSAAPPSVLLRLFSMEDRKRDFRIHRTSKNHVYY